MRAIVNSGPNRLEMLELPLPQPGPGQVRIRTGACAICATDLLMFPGWERTAFPTIPGHEWSGTVEAAGEGVNPGWVGQRCVAENFLPGGGEVGFEHPGGYGEYFLTEAANLYPLPADFPFTQAALVEPLSVCLRAFKRLRLEDQPRVLILGDGPIGLLLLMLARHAGMEQVFVVGGRAGRLQLAEELGARQTLNFHAIAEDLPAGVLKAAGQPFPIVIEASGSSLAVQSSLHLVGECGKILVLGDYGESRANFAWNHLLHQQIELIGSNAGAGAWGEAVRLAVEGALPLEKLITHTFPADQFAEAVALAQSQREEVVKIVLEWEPT